MKTLKASFINRSKILEYLSEDGGFLNSIHKAAVILRDCVQSGKAVLVCGNGGSAAEALHLSGEIIGRFLVERDGLPAIALDADVATLTAIANDYGYNHVFARQVRAYKEVAKVFILLSTSGNSANLLDANNEARLVGMTTIGLLGRDGGALAKACDVSIIVPSWSTPEIQEVHLALVHLLCEYVDGTLS